jgi:hypothetical protein
VTAAVVPVAGDPLPATLSSDELRAAARLAGYAPAPAFDTAWGPDESGVADAVALRGLLARGLAGVDTTGEVPEVTLTADARAALGPILAPDTLVEVCRDGIGGRRRQLAGARDGRTVRATECHPAIWHLVPVEGPPADAMYPVAAKLLPRTVAPATADAADLDVLAQLQTTVSVRTVRRLGPAAREAAAIVWLEAGSAGTWLVGTAEPDDLDDEPDPHRIQRTAVELTGAEPATIRAALAQLLQSEEMP